MGFPLSRYTVLHELCEDERFCHQDYYFLRKVKLMGLIIHDPDDRVFEDEMQMRFGYLDQATTDSFLFMTFMGDPSLPSRNRYRGDEMGVDFERQTLNNVRREEGYGAVDLIYRLKEWLGVAEDFPVLLLTDNLLGKEFDVVKISEKTICDQLVEIGRFCSECGDGKVNRESDAYAKLLKHLDADARRVTLDQRMADIIRDALAPIAMKKRDYAYSMQRARKQAYSVLDRFSRRYKEAKENRECDEEELSKSRDRFYDYLSSVVEIKKKKTVDYSQMFRNTRQSNTVNYTSFQTLSSFDREQSFDSPYLIDYNKLSGTESFSKLSIKKFNSLSRLEFGEFEMNEEEKGIVEGIKDDDYSELSSFLGRFFENEINHSIVQLMRQSVGIPMPEYYMKRYEGPGSFVIETGTGTMKRPMNLNCWKNYGATNICQMEWPTLGTSLYGWRKMTQVRKAYDKVCCGNPQKFDDNWYKIFQIRNIGAHPNPVSLDEFKTIFTAVNGIVNYHLQDMVALKNRLRCGELMP